MGKTFLPTAHKTYQINKQPIQYFNKISEYGLYQCPVTNWIYELINETETTQKFLCLDELNEDQITTKYKEI